MDFFQSLPGSSRNEVLVTIQAKRNDPGWSEQRIIRFLRSFMISVLRYRARNPNRITPTRQILTDSEDEDDDEDDDDEGNNPGPQTGE